MVSRLAEIAITNTGTAVYSRVQAIMNQKADQQKVNELSKLIDTLIEENGELSRIANAFKQELVAQQISDQEIAYITENIIPVLKDLAEKTAGSTDAAAAKKAEEALDILARLLSVETLTVLQLVGFNFKKAIGEPLTSVLQKLITAQLPLDKQSVVENNRLGAELNIELAKIAQDEEATDRLKRVLRIWRSGGDER